MDRYWEQLSQQIEMGWFLLSVERVSIAGFRAEHIGVCSLSHGRASAHIGVAGTGTAASHIGIAGTRVFNDSRAVPKCGISLALGTSALTRGIAGTIIVFRAVP